MTSRKRLSAALFIEFLRRLITNYPKKIFLVADGLPAHKAKSVHRFVQNQSCSWRAFRWLPVASEQRLPNSLPWLCSLHSSQSSWNTGSHFWFSSRVRACFGVSSPVPDRTPSSGIHWRYKANTL